MSSEKELDCYVAFKKNSRREYNEEYGLNVRPSLTAIPFLSNEQLEQMIQSLQ